MLRSLLLLVVPVARPHAAGAADRSTNRSTNRSVEPCSMRLLFTVCLLSSACADVPAAKEDEEGDVTRCPDYSGLVDGRSWTYELREAYAQDEGVDGTWTSAVSLAGDGTYTIDDHIAYVLDTGEQYEGYYTWTGFCDAYGSWLSGYFVTASATGISDTSWELTYTEPWLSTPTGLALGVSWTADGAGELTMEGGNTEQVDVTRSYEVTDATTAQVPAGTYEVLEITSEDQVSYVDEAVGRVGDATVFELVSVAP